MHILSCSELCAVARGRTQRASHVHGASPDVCHRMCLAQVSVATVSTGRLTVHAPQVDQAREAFTDYRVDLLEYLKDRGFEGVYQFLYSTMTPLLNRRRQA